MQKIFRLGTIWPLFMRIHRADKFLDQKRLFCEGDCLYVEECPHGRHPMIVLRNNFKNKRAEFQNVEKITENV
jgi:hypothetical protein